MFEKKKKIETLICSRSKSLKHSTHEISHTSTWEEIWSLFTCKYQISRSKTKKITGRENFNVVILNNLGQDRAFK